jgi:hypothetical protein
MGIKKIKQIKKVSSIALAGFFMGVILTSPSSFAASKTPSMTGLGEGIVVSTDEEAAQPKKKSPHQVQVALFLDKLTMIKTTETHGDELYIDVTAFSSVDKPSIKRVPEYPMHWLSKYSANLKNIKLWEKAIQDGETVALVISLVEEELPPWEVDELVGSIKLKLTNHKGHIQKTWSIPNTKITHKEKEANTFELTGENADYKIHLRLK